METITKSQANEILEKLVRLQSDIEYIKNNMVDVDCIMTEDDRAAIDEAEREFKEGKTTSLEDFEKSI